MSVSYYVVGRYKNDKSVEKVFYGVSFDPGCATFYTEVDEALLVAKELKEMDGNQWYVMDQDDYLNEQIWTYLHGEK